MSIVSWKREFYKGSLPLAAKTELGAIDHSLLKWTGLSTENLTKHGLQHGLRRVAEQWVYNQVTRACFEVSSNECALCYHNDTIRADPWECDTCSLAIVSSACGRGDSPYQHWVQTSDNLPMVAALTQARERAVSHLDAPAQK